MPRLIALAAIALTLVGSLSVRADEGFGDDMSDGSIDPGLGYMLATSPDLGSYGGPAVSIRANRYFDWFVMGATLNVIPFGMQIASYDAIDVSIAASMGFRVGRFRVLGGIHGGFLLRGGDRDTVKYMTVGPYAGIDFKIIKYLALDVRYRGTSYSGFGSLFTQVPADGFGHSVQVGLSFPIPVKIVYGTSGGATRFPPPHHPQPPPQHFHPH